MVKKNLGCMVLKYMRVAKHAHTRGSHWVTPVKISLGLQIAQEDKQLPVGDP